MERNRPGGGLYVLAFSVALAVYAGSAGGVVLHPNPTPGGPELEVPAGQRPSDDVVGRWSSSASVVALSPRHIITTAHGGGGVGSSVTIGGQSYQVGWYYRHPTADLRVAVLTDLGEEPDLQDYVDIYRGSDEDTQTFVLGGYGVGRGDPLQTFYNDQWVTYGYEWGEGGNDTLRWGSNRIDPSPGFDLFAVWDGPGIAAAVPYEAIPADHDSGAGWFLDDGGEWKLAGLTQAVERTGESWYRNSGNPELPDPDEMYAVRVSTNAYWVDMALDGPLAGDFNTDGTVNITDLGALASNWQASGPGVNWSDGDVNHDGKVNITDLGAVASNWKHEYAPPAAATMGGGQPVPEPGTLALLAVGAAALALRRRRKG
ncbi:hypothetical protein LCGC14_1596200 [marine sediment metagenome]|uniref:Ice-binding protein C-terminal domain-containing protein n=1 Tax=marine sediment metagenome TaxID=412755 RepID=A0A0F9ICK3_9ZZZZ